MTTTDNSRADALTVEQRSVIDDATRVLEQSWEHATADRLRDAFAIEAEAARQATSQADWRGDFEQHEAAITCSCMKCGKPSENAAPCSESYCPLNANHAVEQHEAAPAGAQAALSFAELNYLMDTMQHAPHGKSARRKDAVVFADAAQRAALARVRPLEGTGNGADEQCDHNYVSGHARNAAAFTTESDMRPTNGMDRTQFHDMAWALWQEKAFDSALLPKLSIHAIRMLWDVLYEAMPCAQVSDADIVALLPGTYYMDPPDGGDVSLLEQLRRMAKDAKSFRAPRTEVAGAVMMPPVKGVSIDGGYVIVTPAGGRKNAPAIKEAILALAGVVRNTKSAFTDAEIWQMWNSIDQNVGTTRPILFANKLLATMPKQQDWQQKAIDLGFKYWHAPDNHGVECTTQQAVDLLQDLLGVEVEIKDTAGVPIPNRKAYEYAQLGSPEFDGAEAYEQHLAQIFRKSSTASENERPEFEVWAAREDLHLAKGNCGWYVASNTEKAWKAWQARAATPQPPSADAAAAGLGHTRDILVRLRNVLESGRALNGISDDRATIYAEALREVLEAPPAQEKAND